MTSRRLHREGPATSFHPDIDRTLPIPVLRQLYLRLRDAIMEGVLEAGHRFPSTRAAAREWKLSRGLVVEAYELLAAEGYIEGRHGSGTFVASGLPTDWRGHSTRARENATGSERRVSVNAVMAQRLQMASLDRTVAFATGLVVHDERTSGLLRRIAARHADFRRNSYADPQGEFKLRSAIAQHLSTSRGVRCGAGQVFVTAGSQQALDLASRVLVTPGETMFVEDPCYPPARLVFALNGAQLVGIPVDTSGFVTDHLRRASTKQPAALYVTPSHQYPTGAVLPLVRRLRLLQFASENGCWIIEDDYDSEFRYEGHPIASLQGLDDDGRVIYVGTFSKALSPELRIGYLVAPPDLVPAFRAVRPALDVAPVLLSQMIVADFLNEGYFPAHLRRMRERYRVSRDRLVDLLRDRLSEHIVVDTPEQGIYLMAHSTGAWANDVALASAAQARSVTVMPASPMYLSEAPGASLILGFAGLSDEEADQGTRRLVDVFRFRSDRSS